MARHSQDNALLNASFRLWDYGTFADLSSLPSHGYLANRWKVTASGANGSVAKGTGPTGIATPKWLRGRDAMVLDITALAGNVTVRQTVEDIDRYGQTFGILTVAISGPAGASVYAGVGDDVRPLRLAGEDTPVVTTHPMMLPDFATPHAGVDVFTSPSQPGRYTLHYAQFELGLDQPRHSGFTVRTMHEERVLCGRYAYPVPAGVSGIAASSSSLPVPVAFSHEMRVTPSLVSPAGSVSAVAMSTGGAVSNSSPVFSWTGASVRGGRLAVGAWSGLVAGQEYMLSSAASALLHADY